MEKISGMGKREACSYILTYYWYHILIFISVIALILLFTVHYGWGNKKPVFTCIIVNQEMDGERDLRVRDEFAKEAGLPREQVVIDSDYNFSFGGFHIEGANEGSYEKFFFKWRNEEIHAVILSESFYRHCKEMGGSFYALDERMEEVGEEWRAYMDEGQCHAVILGNDSLTKGKLLLAFPKSQEMSEGSWDFLKYVCDKAKETGGKNLEEIIN